MTFLARLRALLTQTPPAGCHHHTAEAFAPVIDHFDERHIAEWPKLTATWDETDFAAVIERHPELLEETP